MANPDRIAFTLLGHPIYWYGVLMAAAIIIAIYLAMIEAKRKRIDEDTMLDLFILLIVCGIVGARVYYVLFEFKHFFGPGIAWWKPFAVWEGGLAIYGATIFGFLAMLFYARKKKIRFTKLADCIAPGLVLAQAIGRWGNFFNQEAYGLPVTNPDLLWFPLSVHIDIPWNNGIHYFNGALCEAPYHLATFFYESAWCLLVFGFLWFFLRKRTKHDGDSFLWYVLLYSFERMFLEGLRGDSLWLIPDLVRVSQALSFVLFVSTLAFMLTRRIKEKKTGLVLWPSPEVILDAQKIIDIAADVDAADVKADEAGNEEHASQPAPPMDKMSDGGQELDNTALKEEQEAGSSEE